VCFVGVGGAVGVTAVVVVVVVVDVVVVDVVVVDVVVVDVVVVDVVVVGFGDGTVVVVLVVVGWGGIVIACFEHVREFQYGVCPGPSTEKLVPGTTSPSSTPAVSISHRFTV
jgi:hypothetical protein